MKKNYFDNNSGTKEKDYWNRMIRGDSEAFEFLIKSLYQDLYRYGLSITGDPEMVRESIQNLFVYIWSNRNNISSAKNPKSYLLVSLRRELNSRLKVLSTFVNISERMEYYLGFTESKEKELIDEEEYNQLRTELKNNIEKLSGRQKEVIHLLYYEGMDAPETAEIIGIKVQSVYNILHEAIKVLKGNTLKR